MKKGFTLIELLIVVAIIAILAAIAVPNFLEAQTRAKISRGLADMRSVVTALEVYKIDSNSYPSDSGHNPAAGYKRFYSPNNMPPAQYTFGYELTTPIAYLTSINGIKDPFRLQKQYTGATFGRQFYAFINYEYRGKLTPGSWTQRALLPHYGPYVMSSAGPDGAIVNDKIGGGDYSAAGVFPAAASPNYDSSNGTLSVGDIYWSPKFPPGNLRFL